MSEHYTYVPHHKFLEAEEGQLVPVTMAHTEKCHYLRVLLVLL